MIEKLTGDDFFSRTNMSLIAYQLRLTYFVDDILRSVLQFGVFYSPVQVKMTELLRKQTNSIDVQPLIVMMMLLKLLRNLLVKKNLNVSLKLRYFIMRRICT